MSRRMKDALFWRSIHQGYVDKVVDRLNELKNVIIIHDVEKFRSILEQNNGKSCPLLLL